MLLFVVESGVNMSFIYEVDKHVSVSEQTTQLWRLIFCLEAVSVSNFENGNPERDVI